MIGSDISLPESDFHRNSGLKVSLWKIRYRTVYCYQM